MPSHEQSFIVAQVIEHEDETLLDTHSDGSPVSNPNINSTATSSLASLAWLEAALSSGLSHANVVKTYDCQTHDPFDSARRATGLSMHALKVGVSPALKSAGGHDTGVSSDSGRRNARRHTFPAYAQCTVGMLLS